MSSGYIKTQYNAAPTDKPKWERIEAGWYVRRVGLGQRLEISHRVGTIMNRLDAPDGKTWVVDHIDSEDARHNLGRFHSYKEARAFADDWKNAR